MMALECPAIRSDALSMLKMSVVATTEDDDALYFDLDVPARDADGAVRFA